MIELLQTLASGGPAGLVIVILVVFGAAFMLLLLIGLCKAAATPMPEIPENGWTPPWEDIKEQKQVWLDEEGERKP